MGFSPGGFSRPPTEDPGFKETGHGLSFSDLFYILRGLASDDPLV
jgi:hypothetical protein